MFGFVYFTNQPQDSYIFSFAACPKIPRRPPCLWLYRRPTISFVFDTLRFILQFRVCLSFSPGSAPGSYKFALLCVSKSLICRLSTSFNEFFPAFYTEKKQGDYYRLDHYSSRGFDIFVGSDRYTSPNMETIRLPVPSNQPPPSNLNQLCRVLSCLLTVLTIHPAV